MERNFSTKTGILLVNLGTPKSYSTKDVRAYLGEFLMDKRVISLPYISRFLLVNLIIKTTRAPKSAKAYEEIWHESGTSPLLYYSKEQEKKLQEKLGEDYLVKIAMRYQEPSISDTLEIFHKEKINDIIALPLYPQYASATTGSSLEKIFKVLSEYKDIPNIKVIGSFYDNPIFIDTWANLIRKYDFNSYDHILMSYHGLPVDQLCEANSKNIINQPKCCQSKKTGNPNCYSYQCFATTEHIAKKLELKNSQYSTSFQSRLGKARWTQPYTAQHLENLIKENKKKILMLSPAFTTDCLETLYELEIEYKEVAENLGGELDVVECPNSHPIFINTLYSLIKQI